MRVKRRRKKERKVVTLIKYILNKEESIPILLSTLGYNWPSSSWPLFHSLPSALMAKDAEFRVLSLVG